MHDSLYVEDRARWTLTFKASVFTVHFKWRFVRENITGNSVAAVPGLNTALCSLTFLLGYGHMGQCLFSWLI